MNRTFNDKRYESNCSPINIPFKNIHERESGIFDFIAAFIGRIDKKRFAAIARVIVSVIFFFGFMGIIGGVEAGSISVEFGLIISLFMVFIEILCFVPKKKS